MTGWRVFWLLAVVLTAAFAGMFVAFGSEEAGLRTLVRATARISFAVFLFVYLASPLRRLRPSPTTRWLLRNRRYLGVSFAWAHGLHALAIVMLAVLLGDAFRSDLLVIVFGGSAYLLLVGMALTSFDRTARWLGPRRWNRLHRTGIHALWAVFTALWTGLAIASPGYLPVAVAAWLAAALRLAAARSRSSRSVAAGDA